MKNEKLRVPKLRFEEFSGDWEEKPLGKYGKLINGLTYSPDNIVEDGLLVLRSSNIQNEQISFEDNVYVNLNVEDEYLTHENDILICVRNGSKRLIGKSLLIPKDLPKSTHGAFMTVFRGDSNKLISHWLKTPMFFKEVHKNLGATINSINGSNLKKFKTFFPTSTQEQEKIASFLSSIDKKINQLSKKDELLQNYKKAMMQKIFSQKLRFKKEDGSDYPKWEEKKLGDLTKINQGLQIAISERLTNKIKGSYFYITNEFLKDNSEKKYFIKNPPPSVICTKDDILMTRTGNTGQVVTDVEGAFHNNFFKINYFKNFNKKFLVYFLNLDSTQKLILRYAGTSTIPDLNHSDFYRLKIKLPSIEEQTKIANFLYFLDTKISKNKKVLEETQKFKKALFQKMFV